MKVVGYSIDRETGIYDSIANYQYQPSYLDFLLTPYPDCIKVFANLDDDVACLLALLKLTPKELGKLAETKELYLINKTELSLPYIINYIPGKWFSIDKGYGRGHQYAGFSDMSQYEETSRPRHPAIDAVQAASLGHKVHEAFVELGYSPKNLISPVNVYRKEVIPKLDLPSYDDVPVEVLELAYECCVGNWVESFAIGHWDKVYDYDMNSAYPTYANYLHDLRQGEWKHSSEYQENATYGYCRCEVMIDQDISPIILQINGNNYTPKGIMQKTLTKAQIDFIDYYLLGYATILDGWWWTETKSPHYPLKPEVLQLYEKKEKSEGVKKGIIKRIMAGSFYGLWLETRGAEFGEHFLSPWAAEIETRTQMAIAEFCYAFGIQPLHIAVDGIVTDKKLPSDVNSREMGEWRLECEGKCLIASSGVVSIDEKNGNRDFSVSYEWLMEQIKAHPKESVISLTKPTVLSLAMAKNLRRIVDVGKEEAITKGISIGDNKRLYKKLPRNFEELMSNQYNAEPWTTDMLEILIEESKKL